MLVTRKQRQRLHSIRCSKPWRALEEAAGDQQRWDTVEMMGCPLGRRVGT